MKVDKHLSFLEVFNNQEEMNRNGELCVLKWTRTSVNVA